MGYNETPYYPKGTLVKKQEFTPASVTGIAASFCSGVVVRTVLRGVLAACTPINPIVSFVGITALSLTVENGVSHYVAKETQNLIDQCKEAWNASEDSK
jgi:hypothetical protein|nr:MAG TPA: hypothetical protein [Caudoviricetes sp.]